LKGLYRDATVFAYVAVAEGWGLPPVEALHAGTRVVASTTTAERRSKRPGWCGSIRSTCRRSPTAW